jgi:hypothetical protein
MDARAEMPFLIAGAFATVDAVMTMRAICMLKVRSSQKPLYQWRTISMGPLGVRPMPRPNAMNVRRTAKMLGSGIYLKDHAAID